MTAFARSKAAAESPGDPRTAVYLRGVFMLLDCIKAFSIDLPDIDTASFRQQVDELSQSVANVSTPRDIDKQMAAGRVDIEDYIGREHRYLRDRDREFRSVIEMLHGSLGSLTEDNANFQRRLEASGGRLDELCGIDDIRRLRQALRTEADQIRSAVAEKRARDASQLKELEQELSSVQVDLDTTRAESMKDPLTGAFNRRALDMSLDRAFGDGDKIALLMLDIDHFKSINDTHGHTVGDRVLVALVERCRALLRDDDMVARYGGEEFAVLMPGSPLRVALKRAKKIVKAIAAATYTADAESSETVQFTVSIGVAVRSAGDTPESLIRRADQALYQAKASGRNRVVSEKDL